MPYKKFNCVQDGQVKYCTKNTKTGQIVHYSSEDKRENGIRMHEMFSHMKPNPGWHGESARHSAAKRK